MGLEYRIFIIDQWFDIKLSRGGKYLRHGRIFRLSRSIEVPMSFKRMSKLKQKIILYVLYFSVQDLFGNPVSQNLIEADRNTLDLLILEGYSLKDINTAFCSTLKEAKHNPILSAERINKLKKG